jgi:PAS domain S-box-containing protein
MKRQSGIWGRTEDVHLWLAILIALALSAYRLSVELIDRLQAFFEPLTRIPVAELLTNILFLWLVALLWVAYRQWRGVVRRERELERIIASIEPEVLLVVEPGRVIRACNQAVLDMFGYAVNEVIGQSTSLLYADRRRPGHPREIYEALEKVGFHVGLAEGRRKNGEEFPLEIVTGSLKGERGAVVLIRDITERKRAEEELQRYQRHLEELVGQRTAELRKKNEDLHRELENRRRMEQQILEISSREKRRIGQDLHDTLGQQLAGLGLMTKALERRLAAKRAPEAEDAARLAEQISEAMNQARRIARGLSPVDRAEEGLVSALRRLAEDTAEVFKVSCRLEMEEPVRIRDHNVATHLYYVTLEALSNAVRHGKATEIVIRLEERDAKGRLIIQDNGKGLPPDLDAAPGMGLHIMRYRAEATGGSLRLEGAGQGGARVVCSFMNTPPRQEDGQ